MILSAPLKKYPENHNSSSRNHISNKQTPFPLTASLGERSNTREYAIFLQRSRVRIPPLHSSLETFLPSEPTSLPPTQPTSSLRPNLPPPSERTYLLPPNEPSFPPSERTYLPLSLPPNLPSSSYNWRQTGRDVGFPSLNSFAFWFF